MARIRSIKPEFPQSESMGRVSREARLCFIMLWTVSDDAGRLRGNSRMLASLLYPYDDGLDGHQKTTAADLEQWLTELDEEGCIVRYEIDGNHYVQIAKWLDHQKIDKPSQSKIPQFVEGSRIVAKPREVSATDLVPVPVSGPVSRTLEGINGADAPDDIQIAFDDWNDLATDTGLPKVQVLTDQRRSALKARLKQAGGIEGWREALRKIRGSPYLLGKRTDWRADFDFAVKQKNFVKLMEGGFDDHKKSGGWAELARAAGDIRLADEVGFPGDEQSLG